MKVTLSEGYEFVPEWNENRDAPEQIVIYCKYLTKTQRDRCVEQDFIYVGEETQIRTRYKNSEMIRMSVSKITGLNVNGEDVTTGDRLVSHPGLSALCEELANEILRNMRVVDVKN